jgi:hypothetical protein
MLISGKFYLYISAVHFLAQNSLEVNLNFFQKVTLYLHEIHLCDDVFCFLEK